MLESLFNIATTAPNSRRVRAGRLANRANRLPSQGRLLAKPAKRISTFQLFSSKSSVVRIKESQPGWLGQRQSDRALRGSRQRGLLWVLRDNCSLHWARRGQVPELEKQDLSWTAHKLSGVSRRCVKKWEGTRQAMAVAVETTKQTRCRSIQETPSNSLGAPRQSHCLRWRRNLLTLTFTCERYETQSTSRLGFVSMRGM